MGNSSSGTAVTVAPGELGALGAQLGSGGEATVFDLPELTCPDVRGALVYKRYRDGHVAPESLRRVVAARNALDEAKRTELDGLSAWPVRVVEERGLAVGIVMPRIPAPFFDSVVRNCGVKQSLREVQNLFIDPARALRLGRPAPTDEERLRICRDFAGGLAFLHEELKVVFGDINPKNAVFRLDARPMVMFLDCDAVRPAGVVAKVKQLDAPDWVPPEGGNLTLATDRYKLGLFVLRCLSPGAWSSVNTDPAAAARLLDAEGLSMLGRALSGDPEGRPSARDWELHLRRLLGEAVAPPELGAVAVDRELVLRGQPVVVEWEALEAKEVEITSGTRVVRVDGRRGRGRTSVPLDESGPVRVRAINDLGSDERHVGPVTVLPPPARQPLTVPVPQLSWSTPGSADPPELALLPLPPIGVRPELPDLLTAAARTAPWPSPPDLRAVGFPLDLEAMLTELTGTDFGFRDSEGGSR
ncbi:hypothetical protein JOF41_000087 [Saccharothrix coeruleofusca]|uniref:hypothetical protein n=1 Tax=Saccharothrix coeruleofusca TaxID=33919 RepID=UPI001AE3DAB0|nr:hypothetical protein [Saccharothrix coeruleofusca]MBP2333909.1 hypothetical protein [Saccharothrix coeruleofusca]